MYKIGERYKNAFIYITKVLKCSAWQNGRLYYQYLWRHFFFKTMSRFIRSRFRSKHVMASVTLYFRQLVINEKELFLFIVQVNFNRRWRSSTLTATPNWNLSEPTWKCCLTWRSPYVTEPSRWSNDNIPRITEVCNQPSQWRIHCGGGAMKWEGGRGALVHILLSACMYIFTFCVPLFWQYALPSCSVPPFGTLGPRWTIWTEWGRC